MFRHLALLALLIAALAISPTVALHAEDGAQADAEGLDSDSDHDRARDLLEHGEIIPLGEIIAHISSEHPGEVVAISLVRKHERWVYQFKILSQDGKLRDLNVDAKNMDVVREEYDD